MISISEYTSKDGITYLTACRKVNGTWVTLVTVNVSSVGESCARSTVASFIDFYFNSCE